MSNPPIIIAIDGPSGAGKGTIASQLATALGYRHVDTGAMYRAIAWRAVHDGVALEDEREIAAMARRAVLVVEGRRTAIDGLDVTDAIRTPDVDQAAARVARLPALREVLVARQRALGAEGGVVMEGRDIGSVVFPQAPVKIYLDASAEERARRRAHDPTHRGQPATIAGVQRGLQVRDQSDRQRPVAPLTLAPDAIYIDTTTLSIEQVLARVRSIVEETLARP